MPEERCVAPGGADIPVCPNPRVGILAPERIRIDSEDRNVLHSSIRDRQECLPTCILRKLLISCILNHCNITELIMHENSSSNQPTAPERIDQTPALNPGDTIGIFRPSSPVNVSWREKYLFGIEQLRRLGFNVVEAH